jgi:hypothetical protein
LFRQQTIPAWIEDNGFFQGTKELVFQPECRERGSHLRAAYNDNITVPVINFVGRRRVSISRVVLVMMLSLVAQGVKIFPVAQVTIILQVILGLIS